MSDKNFQNDASIHQKYLDKIIKMRQDQDASSQKTFELLQMQLAQTNALLSELIKVSGSGSTVASSKKIVPFHTGSQDVGQLLIPPQNPDDYPTKVDVYKINDNRVIPHMTLINDGPGDIFFINAYAKDVFNEREGHLNVNDQRELFNVYEIRLRSTLPLTTFRLIEGIFRTGSFAPNTKANIEIRPTVQPNEVLLNFTLEFDNDVPITINAPTVQNFNTNNSFVGLIAQPPLPPGQTAALVDSTTGLPMPFTIPEGFVFETFGIVANMSTDFTFRSFIELATTPITNPTDPIFTSIPIPVFPASNRGMPVNESLNLSFFTTQAFEPLGVPPGTGGRRILLIITNDDPFNNMIGEIDFIAILKRIT